MIRRTALIIALVLSFALVAAACGDNAHPNVDILASGNGDDVCHIVHHHPKESASSQRATADIVNAGDGCVSVELCINYGEGTTAAPDPLCTGPFTGPPFPDELAIAAPFGTIIDSYVIVQAAYYPTVPTKCLYHDVNGANDPFVCAAGVPL